MTLRGAPRRPRRAAPVARGREAALERQAFAAFLAALLVGTCRAPGALPTAALARPNLSPTIRHSSPFPYSAADTRPHPQPRGADASGGTLTMIGRGRSGAPPRPRLRSPGPRAVARCCSTTKLCRSRSALSAHSLRGRLFQVTCNDGQSSPEPAAFVPQLIGHRQQKTTTGREVATSTEQFATVCPIALTERRLPPNALFAIRHTSPDQAHGFSSGSEHTAPVRSVTAIRRRDRPQESVGQSPTELRRDGPFEGSELPSLPRDGEESEPVEAELQAGLV